MKVQVVAHLSKKAWMLDESMNLAMDPTEREEHRKELFLMKGELRKEIERYAEIWAARAAVCIFVPVVVLLYLANLDMLERGIELTWELLAALAVGAATYWVARREIRENLMRKYHLRLGG